MYCATKNIHRMTKKSNTDTYVCKTEQLSLTNSHSTDNYLKVILHYKFLCTAVTCNLLLFCFFSITVQCLNWIYNCKKLLIFNFNDTKKYWQCCGNLIIFFSKSNIMKIVNTHFLYFKIKILNKKRKGEFTS